MLHVGIGPLLEYWPEVANQQQAIYDTLQCPHASTACYLPMQSLSMHALPYTLCYVNRGHLAKCSATLTRIFLFKKKLLLPWFLLQSHYFCEGSDPTTSTWQTLTVSKRSDPSLPQIGVIAKGTLDGGRVFCFNPQVKTLFLLGPQHQPRVFTTN